MESAFCRCAARPDSQGEKTEKEVCFEEMEFPLGFADPALFGLFEPVNANPTGGYEPGGYAGRWVGADPQPGV
jgi:hypothetical protein